LISDRDRGATILEAAEKFDAGAILASHEFALRGEAGAKSSLYRDQLTEVALRGVLERYGIPLQIEDRGVNAGCSRRISGSKRHRDLSIGF
jgi:methionyl-tRNA formyltransferase